MDASEALTIVNEVINQKRLERLGHIYELVFHEAWQGKTYQQIAVEVGYDFDYVREVGSRLWLILSQCFGEKVTKKNLQSVLKHYKNSRTIVMPPPETSVVTATAKLVDWGEAPDITSFYGRELDCQILEQWIVEKSCRMVAILGMGGIGKTALAVNLGTKLQERFDYLIWRSLKNAPTVMQVVRGLNTRLSGNVEPNLPNNLSDQLCYLMNCLRNNRCLMLFDGAESILQSGAGKASDSAGQYLANYESYSELFRQIGELQHSSCLILTSREQPREFALLEGNKVRSWYLGGLNVSAVKATFQERGEFSGSESEWEYIASHYGGNPLALKIIAAVVLEFFAGQLTPLVSQLQQDRWIFADIRNLLDQHFNRLSEAEKRVLYWLTVMQKVPVLTDMPTEILPTASLQEFLTILDSLRRRSMLEKTNAGFTQQPVVIEYITQKLVEQIYQQPTLMQSSGD